ncbi:MAG: hypothetical protein M3O86_06840 [Actinomycetota bacterium]|nr:hypothetical protein [Actinomycetota bacterium]
MFAIAPDITEASCAGVSGARTCQATTVAFNGWPLWIVAAAIAVATVAVVRQRRGVRRASPRRWAAMTLSIGALVPLAALLSGYEVWGLGTQAPAVFPAAASVFVGILALRRRQYAVASGCFGVGTGIVVAAMAAERSFGPAWWFDHNTGLVLCATAVALVAASAAVWWRRLDAR